MNIKGEKKWFLYIVPLKQGLKLKTKFSSIMVCSMFLYIVPLKQGLKPVSNS